MIQAIVARLKKIRNLRIPYSYLLFAPAVIWCLGFAANAIVMAANNGQMPVLVPGGCPAEGIADGIHACMTSATHLKILADWVFIRRIPAMFSPGDIMETFSEVTYIPALIAWAALMIRDHNR